MLTRYRIKNGYRDVLAVGLPLMVSMASNTLMLFTDRIFLSTYSVDAIAAALPAGIASFLPISFCLGTAGYVAVFVAQYVGGGRPARVGAAMWQGIWFSLAAGVVLALGAVLGGPIFELAGHPGRIRELEAAYFAVLMLGGVFPVLVMTLSSLHAGRGLTRPVMVVNLLGAGLNIPLDYALIYGRFGLPELGILGAGLATVASGAFTALLFAATVFTREAEAEFGTRSGWRPDRELFGRLMRFGLPGGVQFFLDIFAITFFVFAVGRLGRVELAATNIAFSINMLAFLPMVGLSHAVSTLVGQAQGAGRPREAETAAASALHLALAYMVGMGLLFVLAPEMLLALFSPRDAAPGEFEAVVTSGVTLLRIIALYSLFDALAMVYFGALKGAGDSRFLMLAMAAIAGLGLIAPVTLASTVWPVGLVGMWSLLILYVSLLGLTFFLRFRHGSWRLIRVIEDEGSGPC